MTKSQNIRETRLAEMESEFHSLLVSCLRECAQGRWGLFGQNDHVEHYERYRGWPEAKRLVDLAHEIKSKRLEFGEANEACERFLHFCSLRGSNVPGEPILAAEFLAELDQS